MWTHDAYINVILRNPSPERPTASHGGGGGGGGGGTGGGSGGGGDGRRGMLDPNYRPPEPEWTSRAGGVYIPRKKKPEEE